MAFVVLFYVIVFCERFEPPKKIRIMDRVLSTRSELQVLLKEFEYRTMVEVGVREGDFAYELLQKWPGFDHYFGIDPYEREEKLYSFVSKC